MRRADEMSQLADGGSEDTDLELATRALIRQEVQAAVNGLQLDARIAKLESIVERLSVVARGVAGALHALVDTDQDTSSIR